MLSLNRGMPRVEEIQRDSNCSKCNAVLSNGQKCLAFPLSKGFTNYKRLCRECAVQVIDKSKDDINKTEQLIDSTYNQTFRE